MVRGGEEREEKRVDRKRGYLRKKNERIDEHLGPHEWFF